MVCPKLQLSASLLLPLLLCPSMLHAVVGAMQPDDVNSMHSSSRGMAGASRQQRQRHFAAPPRMYSRPGAAHGDGGVSEGMPESCNTDTRDGQCMVRWPGGSSSHADGSIYYMHPAMHGAPLIHLHPSVVRAAQHGQRMRQQQQQQQQQQVTHGSSSAAPSSSEDYRAATAGDMGGTAAVQLASEDVSQGQDQSLGLAGHADPLLHGSGVRGYCQRLKQQQQQAGQAGALSLRHDAESQLPVLCEVHDMLNAGPGGAHSASQLKPTHFKDTQQASPPLLHPHDDRWPAELDPYLYDYDYLVPEEDEAHGHLWDPVFRSGYGPPPCEPGPHPGTCMGPHAPFMQNLAPLYDDDYAADFGAEAHQMPLMATPDPDEEGWTPYEAVLDAMHTLQDREDRMQYMQYLKQMGGMEAEQYGMQGMPVAEGNHAWGMELSQAGGSSSDAGSSRRPLAPALAPMQAQMAGRVQSSPHAHLAAQLLQRQTRGSGPAPHPPALSRFLSYDDTDPDADPRVSAGRPQSPGAQGVNGEWPIGLAGEGSGPDAPLREDVLDRALAWIRAAVAEEQMAVVASTQDHAYSGQHCAEPRKAPRSTGAGEAGVRAGLGRRLAQAHDSSSTTTASGLAQGLDLAVDEPNAFFAGSLETLRQGTSLADGPKGQADDSPNSSQSTIAAAEQPGPGSTPADGSSSEDDVEDSAETKAAAMPSVRVVSVPTLRVGGPGMFGVERGSGSLTLPMRSVEQQLISPNQRLYGGPRGGAGSIFRSSLTAASGGRLPAATTPGEPETDSPVGMVRTSSSWNNDNDSNRQPSPPSPPSPPPPGNATSNVTTANATRVIPDPRPSRPRVRLPPGVYAPSYAYVPYTNRILFSGAPALLQPYLGTIYAGVLYVGNADPLISAMGFGARAGLLLDFYREANYYTPFTFFSIGPSSVATWAATARSRGQIGVAAKARSNAQTLFTFRRDLYADNTVTALLGTRFFAGTSGGLYLFNNPLINNIFLIQGPDLTRVGR